MATRPREVIEKFIGSTSLKMTKALPDPSKYKSYSTQSSKSVESLSGLKLSGFGLNTSAPPLSLRGKSLNEFVTAVHYAFCDEVPIQLSPDCVWIAITQAFGIHVTQNAEAMRSKLVNFDEGKKKITIIDDTLVMDSADNDWTRVFDGFSEGIAKYAGSETVDMLSCEFSTTTPTTRLASQVVLFEAMSKFFSYHTMTKCGIAEIFLDGTVEDWERVRTKAGMLRKFELDWWLDHLLPLLDEFVLTAQHLKGGQPLKQSTQNFWRHFYHYGEGSGGAHVNGWFNCFFPYITTGGGQEEFEQNGHLDWNGRAQYNILKGALAECEARDDSKRTDVFIEIGGRWGAGPSAAQVSLAISQVHGFSASDPAEWQKIEAYGSPGGFTFHMVDLEQRQRLLQTKPSAISVEGTESVWDNGKNVNKPKVFQAKSITPYDRVGGSSGRGGHRPMSLEQAKVHVTKFEMFEQERRAFGGNGPGVYPPSYTNTPMVWEYYGNDHDMIMRAGFLGTQQDPETRAIRPAIGWAVARKDGSTTAPAEREDRKRQRFGPGSGRG